MLFQGSSREAAAEERRLVRSPPFLQWRPTWGASVGIVVEAIPASGFAAFIRADGVLSPAPLSRELRGRERPTRRHFWNPSTPCWVPIFIYNHKGRQPFTARHELEAVKDAISAHSDESTRRAYNANGEMEAITIDRSLKQRTPHGVTNKNNAGVGETQLKIKGCERITTIGGFLVFSEEI